MKRTYIQLVVIAFLSVCTYAQSCSEISAMSEMAGAKSLATLHEASKRAGNDYRARLILAIRSFQLQPRSKGAAAHLLRVVPEDDVQQRIVLTLSDSLCDGESVADMKALAKVSEDFARELASAVILVPSLLPCYLRYATVAVQDPHSTYAMEMKQVCRKLGGEFTRAVRELPEGEMRAFATQVMNPDSCKPIVLPEDER